MDTDRLHALRSAILYSDRKEMGLSMTVLKTITVQAHTCSSARVADSCTPVYWLASTDTSTTTASVGGIMCATHTWSVKASLCKPTKIKCGE